MGSYESTNSRTVFTTRKRDELYSGIKTSPFIVRVIVAISWNTFTAKSIRSFEVDIRTLPLNTVSVYTFLSWISTTFVLVFVYTTINGFNRCFYCCKQLIFLLLMSFLAHHWLKIINTLEECIFIQFYGSNYLYWTVLVFTSVSYLIRSRILSQIETPFIFHSKLLWLSQYVITQSFKFC